MKKLMLVLVLLSSVWISDTLASGAYIGIIRVPRPPPQDQDKDKTQKTNKKNSRSTSRQTKSTPARSSSGNR